MADKTISVTLPAHVWGRLASIADSQGVRVADVVALAVAREIRDVRVVDQLSVLQDALDRARADGWRAPRRGKKTMKGKHDDRIV